MTEKQQLEWHARRLCEFFDTVQIFVSRHDTQTNLTHRYEAGYGNLLARMYQTETWTSEQEFEDDDEFDD